MYETGHGVDSDPARAAVFFTQACDLGERRGCVSFAVLQAQGRGVPLDVEAARATFESACKDGFFDACTSLAVMLASGPKPDLVRARELLTRSCDGKFAPACELLKSLPPLRARSQSAGYAEGSSADYADDADSKVVTREHLRPAVVPDHPTGCAGNAGASDRQGIAGMREGAAFIVSHSRDVLPITRGLRPRPRPRERI